MNDLEIELVAAMDDMDDTARAWFRRLGVPEMALWQWPGPIGTATIEVDKFGIYTPTESERRAFIQPVLVGPRFSMVADLVAWFPDHPQRWWTRRRAGLPLGAHQLELAEIEGTALMLRKTPLSWLIASGDGCCPLDWKMSAPALRVVPCLVCENDLHGREVRRRLIEPIPPVPEIRILRKAA